MKSTQCTPTHQGLSNGTKHARRGVLSWKISMRQINREKKTNKFLFIDKFRGGSYASLISDTSYLGLYY